MMAELVKTRNQPCLILTPNKTLAAQLTRELAALLPTAAVELFVSHFSVYVPEAFHVASNTFIPKTSVVNEQLEAMRHRATRVCARTRLRQLLGSDVSIRIARFSTTAQQLGAAAAWITSQLAAHAVAGAFLAPEIANSWSHYLTGAVFPSSRPAEPLRAP